MSVEAQADPRPGALRNGFKDVMDLGKECQKAQAAAQRANDKWVAVRERFIKLGRDEMGLRTVYGGYGGATYRIEFSGNTNDQLTITRQEMI